MRRSGKGAGRGGRHGIAAALMPDPVVLVAELFGTRIAEHARHGEPAALRAAFPAGYLAVQCSAVFGDDATLDALAAQLALAPASARAQLSRETASADPSPNACYCSAFLLIGRTTCPSLRSSASPLSPR